MLLSSAIRKIVQGALISFASVSTLVLVMPNEALAAKAKSEISAKVGAPLQEAQKLLTAKKYKEALTKVKEAEAISGKNAAEEKIINELLASIHFQVKDYQSGLAVYENMLAKNQFSADEVNKRILTMAQAYMGIKNYPKALQYAERYLKEAGPDSEVSRQIAQIYLVQGDFAKAADLSSKYIKFADASGKPASEDWYKVWMKSLFDQKKTTELADAVEQTLAVYPNAGYWEDMFKYVNIESSFNDRQNIIKLRLMDAVGVAKGPHYIDIAELSLAAANPGDAKTFLEKGMAKGLVTGEREKKLLAKATSEAAGDLSTLGAIEKQALSAPNGESLVRVGEGYLGHGQYEKAIELIGKGIAKGGVSFKDDATINLGIAYLNAKKTADAVKTFKSVPASSKVARLARLWALQATKPAVVAGDKPAADKPVADKPVKK